MVSLIIVRHGQSDANKKNIYTGWTDSMLTDTGKIQAINAGIIISKLGIEISDYHTSILSRAIKTTYLIQEKLGDLYKPVHKSWRLNERHYGALRGLNKEDTKVIYGKKMVALWRRSYKQRPPQLEKPDPTIGRYKELDIKTMPLGESLEDAKNRVIPYYINSVVPKLIEGKNQIIVAHGSTLRALIKYIESIPDEAIDGVEVGNAEPIVYEFNKNMNILNKKTPD